MGFDKKVLDRLITAADPQDHKSSARFATAEALTPYARVGNVITADDNGEMANNGGVTPVLGDSVLLLTQGTASDEDNGLYTVTQLGDVDSPFILTRRSDADGSDLVTSGMSVKVEEGTFAGQTFVLSTPNPIVLNTTELVFVVEVGGYFKSSVGKVDLLMAPIPATGDLTLGSLLVLEPPSGVWVTYPFRIEYVYKVQSSGTKGVAIYAGALFFSSDDANPAVRLVSGTGAVTALVAGSSITAGALEISALGEIGVTLANSAGTDGWAQVSLTVGGPFITVA